MQLTFIMITKLYGYGSKYHFNFMKKTSTHPYSQCMISTKHNKSHPHFLFYQFHPPKACENAKLSLRVTWHANALVGIAGPKYANEGRNPAGDALAPEEQRAGSRGRARNMSRSTDFAPRSIFAQIYICIFSTTWRKNNCFLRRVDRGGTKY